MSYPRLVIVNHYQCEPFTHASPPRLARPFHLADGIERIFNELLVPDQAIGTKLVLEREIGGLSRFVC
jgi:hypothetical protein